MILTRFVLFAVIGFCSSYLAAQDLKSWRDTPSREAIVDFIQAVTNPDNKDYVRPEDRIAVFDNDGTLWAEQPMYFQLAFAIDEVKRMASSRPEWQGRQPYQAVLDNDLKALMAGGEQALLDLVLATHSGQTAEQFDQHVQSWLNVAQHPSKKRPYTELVYQPMLELLSYLRANEFKVFIVSGGGVGFMRAWTEEVYGIPSERVIGSRLAVKYLVIDGTPQLLRLPKMDFIDDKAGKPVGIINHIGKRPIMAFGNSDGDREMLEWTMAGEGLRFAGLIWHTDGEREWAYDRDSHIGKLDKAMDQANSEGWLLVDMKKDWQTVFK